MSWARWRPYLRQRTVLVLAFILAGCAPRAPGTQVEQDWKDTMARLSLTGIYPITEDLQPGDVLLDVTPARSGDPQPALQRLGSLPLDTLRLHFQTREHGRLLFEGLPAPGKPAAPAATAEKPSAGTTVTTTASAPGAATITSTTTVNPRPAAAAQRVAAPAKPAAASAPPTDRLAELHILDPDTVQKADEPRRTRLQRVALPDMNVARVYDTQISGAAPIGLASLGAAFGARGAAAVLIHLRKLAMLGLDSLQAQDVLDEARLPWLRKNRLTPARLLSLSASANPALGLRLCRGEGRGAGQEAATIRIVNRVLYAHEIQYEYTREGSFAARVAADVAASQAARTLVPSAALASVAAGPGVPAAGASAAQLLDAQEARLRALEAATAASVPTTPGVRTRLGVGSYGNTALTDEFLRPMAVGYVPLVSYTVRGSLLLTGLSPEESDRQLRALRAVCAGLVGGEGDYATLTAFSPIENLACSNTRELKQVESSLEVAPLCPRPEDPAVKPPVRSEALTTQPPQSPARGSRSLW